MLRKYTVNKNKHSLAYPLCKVLTVNKLDGCIVWNAHNTVLGEEALLIHIVPVGYAT